MQVVYENCAGLDVHKKTVVACLITPKEKGDGKRKYDI
ncbi:IS110 family transposase [Microcystis aeruginosa str. Chao 1910]|nr:IS110 family transposase [Microcystis aeruginosa str. Chao 1910]